MFFTKISQFGKKYEDIQSNLIDLKDLKIAEKTMKVEKELNKISP